MRACDSENAREEGNEGNGRMTDGILLQKLVPKRTFPVALSLSLAEPAAEPTCTPTQSTRLYDYHPGLRTVVSIK
jgi:hypothetical protein